MASLKLTMTEGADQFHAEGDAEVVERLLAEWKHRVDTLREDARAYMERMTGHGPVGPGTTRGPLPFLPRPS